MSTVPRLLSASIGAVLIAAAGGGAWFIDRLPGNDYLRQIANDKTTSLAIKVAMVEGFYFESSNQLRTKPYVAPEGNLTVCNGLTAATIGPIDRNRQYTPAECYELERNLYVQYEASLRRLHPNWDAANPLQQASNMDMVHNVGLPTYRASTMRRLFDAGKFIESCEQNPRWVYATINGVKKRLAGLVVRRDANESVCKAEALQV